MFPGQWLLEIMSIISKETCGVDMVVVGFSPIKPNFKFFSTAAFVKLSRRIGRNS